MTSHAPRWHPRMSALVVVPALVTLGLTGGPAQAAFSGGESMA
jgi:hypothetical protein